MLETFSNRIKISLLNLCIVALIGVLMRYKIGFVFPHFEQINLQHAHSHFAFYGWLTHTLMTLMIAYLDDNDLTQQSKKYRILLVVNLICSYGMLISFVISGYNVTSIVLSIIPIFIALFFGLLFLKDIRGVRDLSFGVKWFKAALLFNLLSSCGSFAITYMMLTKNIPQHLYLAATYFYLHFQYNGWFFFASVGFLQLYFQKMVPYYQEDKKVFWLLALSCFPAYFLSTLWMNLPVWIYVLVVIAAILQCIAWLLLLKKIVLSFSLLHKKSNNLTRYLFVIVCVGLSIKFALQLGSVIPSISKLAFGFRPIVIAYLHLVLLAILSVFLLTYLMANHFIKEKMWSKIGLSIFVAGIYLTEVGLAVQGVASFSYIVVPYINQSLFFLSTLMFSGIFILTLSNLSPGKK